jgi:hypothetical protein
LFDQEQSDATEITNTLRIDMLQRKTIASREEYKIATGNAKKYVGEKRDSFKKTSYVNWKKVWTNLK